MKILPSASNASIENSNIENQKQASAKQQDIIEDSFVKSDTQAGDPGFSKGQLIEMAKGFIKRLEAQKMVLHRKFHDRKRIQNKKNVLRFSKKMEEIERQIVSEKSRITKLQG